MLDWPFEMLRFDVEHNDLWWPEWGVRPPTEAGRSLALRTILDEAPRLIPLVSRRFIPEEPKSAGNPVFSLHGQDTIYYGATLAEYFDSEQNGCSAIGLARYIWLWTDLARRNAMFSEN